MYMNGETNDRSDSSDYCDNSDYRESSDDHDSSIMLVHPHNDIRIHFSTQH